MLKYPILTIYFITIYTQIKLNIIYMTKINIYY